MPPSTLLNISDHQRVTLDNDIISEEVFDEIYRELIMEEDSTKMDGSLKQKNWYNPYYLGGKYLSTFELLIENKTEKN